MELANFGLRVAKLRSDKRVSARDMSLGIGKCANYINKVERGKCRPSMETFFDICEYLGVTAVDFFEESNQHPVLIRGLIADCMMLDHKSQAHVAGIVRELTRKRR